MASIFNFFPSFHSFMPKASGEKETIKILTDIALKFGEERKGCFFVVTNRNIARYCKPIYPNLFAGHAMWIKDKGTQAVVQKLAELDGAVIVRANGKVLANGVEIRKTRRLPGHGMRHAAALGIASIPKVISIITSEEDCCVRVFRDGRTFIEINPLTKAPPTLAERIAELVTSPHISIIGGGGLASLLLGVNPLVAAIVFAGSYIATKAGIVSLADFIRSGKLKIDHGKR